MSEHMPLSSLIGSKEGHQLLVDTDHPMPVLHFDIPWICTAILDNTAILVSTTDPHERYPVRHEYVMVDPANVQWQEVKNGHHRNSRSPWRATVDPLGVREKSDARAKKDQEQHAKREQAEREAAAEESKRLKNSSDRATPPAPATFTSTVTANEGGVPAVVSLKNEAARPHKNDRPPLTFKELVGDLKMLRAERDALAGEVSQLLTDNRRLEAENQQLRADQAELYDELHAIVGGIKKAKAR